MIRICTYLSVLSVLLLQPARSVGQALGSADRGAPGDVQIQEYLARMTEQVHDDFSNDLRSLEQWEQLRPRYQREYMHMLGLWPTPERTALHAQVTGTFNGPGYVVDLLHYQSRPGLYVTANLYRPSSPVAKALPAILYVCGHASRGRDGNKTAYQSHGIWFARHGYICLIVDTLQLGEIAATHHGTYREQRWWWHARGYTSAGVECWNGIRGIDYLTQRKDVDPNRIGVTGISGGGAATFWIAAADPRVAVAVPVSGMADLPSYVSNRVINGHCDCMFLHNTFRWPWTRIAALIAPRPLLFVNSDNDRIFPMDANRRVINRLERLYSLYGAGDQVDSVVSIGGHAYRSDIRRAAFRFINTHLQGNPQPVTDSEIDLVTQTGKTLVHPIPPHRLRVFPADDDIPADQRNTSIDRHFVPRATVSLPDQTNFTAWQQRLRQQLRRVGFGVFPERIPPAIPAKHNPNQPDSGTLKLITERGITSMLTARAQNTTVDDPAMIILVVASSGGQPESLLLHSGSGKDGAGKRHIYECHPRGSGPNRWTKKNPPNYVERSLVLLGSTADTGRIRDIIACARFLKAKHQGRVPVYVAGSAAAGLIAVYAALWEPDIAGAAILRPPTSHMSPGAPQVLNVLRVCDAPHIAGLLAPKRLYLSGADPSFVDTVRAIYTAADASSQLSVR